MDLPEPLAGASYEFPLATGRPPSDVRAVTIAEAIHVLETGYRNGDAIGYDGALYVAVRFGVEGIEWVLSAILDAVRMCGQRKHIEIVGHCLASGLLIKVVVPPGGQVLAVGNLFNGLAERSLSSIKTSRVGRRQE